MWTLFTGLADREFDALKNLEYIKTAIKPLAMQFHPNELFLVYDPKTNAGKQVKAIAKDICSNINEVDVTQEKLSPTYWKEIVSLVKMNPDDMLDRTSPEYKKKVAGNTYTMDGWLELLVHNGTLVKSPIVIFKGKAVFCNTPTDILKLMPEEEAKVMPHLRGYHGRS